MKTRFILASLFIVTICLSIAACGTTVRGKTSGNGPILIQSTAATVVATAIMQAEIPAVSPAESPAEPPAEPTTTSQLPLSPDPKGALDTALLYLAEHYGEGVIPADSSWITSNITPEGIAGSTTLQYRAESNVAIVEFPLVNPASTVYDIAIVDEASGFSWQGQVDAQGHVTESVEAEDGTLLEDSIPTGEETLVESMAEPVERLIQPDKPDYSDWLTFDNKIHGYRFSYPPGTHVMGNDLAQTVSIEGPVVGEDHWPWFFIDHYDSEFYRPPAGTDVSRYVLDANTGYDTVGEAISIAGLPALHLVYDASPQAYGFDDYYFIKDGQLFRISILHNGGRQDWDLYNQFLSGFSFETSTKLGAGAVDEWRGILGRYPAGFQSEYYLDSDDGQRFVVEAAAESVKSQISQAAWLGQSVELTGEMSPLPGLIQVTGLTVIADGEPGSRNLTTFAVPAASSILPADRLGTYYEWSAVDGRIDSPWCEGADGFGEAEWLLLEFPGTLEVTQLAIDTGYDYNEDIFAKNNRLRSVTLIFSDGEQIDWTFEDERGLQLVPLARAPGPGVQAEWVKLVINSVYPGNRYDDTCLGEVEVWGHPQ